MLEAILPVSFINHSILPDSDPIPMLIVIFKFSKITMTMLKEESIALHFIFMPLPYIESILGFENSQALYIVLIPKSWI